MNDMLSLSITNFRAFSRVGPIEIKPLTLLVGENSSGKTSFLAALRVALSLGALEGGYFNTAPFNLGSFEDIVHSSGPVSARERFSITTSKYFDLRKSSFFPPEDDIDLENVRCTTSIFFRSRHGETAISSIEMKVNDLLLTFNPHRKTTFAVRRQDEILLESESDPQLSLLGGIEESPIGLSIMRYVLIEQYFRWSKGPNFDKEVEDDVKLVIRAFDAVFSPGLNVLSSPPIRSVPKRVYTGGNEGDDQGGIHTPHELSKIKRSNRSRWQHLHAGLTRFGRLSGLFTRFDITKLTRQDSGPFQLKVTVRGRPSNIIDVGYGVSQSMPIITDMIESSNERTAFLLQQPEVHLHPKAQAALGTFFSECISDRRQDYIIVETHSDYILDRVRLSVRRGTLHSSMVSILYFETSKTSVEIHQIGIDGMGNVTGAPVSYRQFFITEQEDVLGL